MNLHLNLNTVAPLPLLHTSSIIYIYLSVLWLFAFEVIQPRAKKKDLFSKSVNISPVSHCLVPLFFTYLLANQKEKEKER